MKYMLAGIPNASGRKALNDLVSNMEKLVEKESQASFEKNTTTLAPHITFLTPISCPNDLCPTEIKNWVNVLVPNAKVGIASVFIKPYLYNHKNLLCLGFDNFPFVDLLPSRQIWKQLFSLDDETISIRPHVTLGTTGLPSSFFKDLDLGYLTRLDCSPTHYFADEDWCKF